MSEIRLEGREPDELELQLARAFERVDAPEGFAARVMQRAAAETQVSEARPEAPDVVAKVVTMRPRVWVGGAIAAMLMVGAFAGEQVHARHQREEAVVAANRQFEAALRVTDQALAQTRAQLERAGLKLGD